MSKCLNLLGLAMTVLGTEEQPGLVHAEKSTSDSRQINRNQIVFNILRLNWNHKKRNGVWWFQILRVSKMVNAIFDFSSYLIRKSKVNLA